MEISRVKRLRSGSPYVMSFEVPKDRAEEWKALIKQGNEKTGDVYTLEVVPYEEKRSTGPYSQNHHINGHIQQLAAAQNVTCAVMKRYVKIRAAEMGYPSEVWRGVVEFKSEAKATVEEARLLIDAAHLIASEYGLTLYEGEGWING